MIKLKCLRKYDLLALFSPEMNFCFKLRSSWILNNVICHDTELNFSDDMYVLKERLMWAL